MEEFEGFGPVAVTLEAGTLAGTAIRMCQSAAALHLGEPDEQGRRLAMPKAEAAWLAILAADALTDAVMPLVDEATATALGATLGSQIASFARRYPTHSAPLPPTWMARLSQDSAPAPAAQATPPAPTAPAQGTGKLPAAPVDVDQMVHNLFQAFIAVAGHHLGDPLPGGGTLDAPDPAEAQLCLTMAGALYGHLFTLLGGEAGERWRAELHAMLDRYEDAAPLPERPGASLEAVVAEAWAAVEAG